MYPSTNTLYGPTASITTLDIVYSASPFVKQSDLGKIISNIQSYLDNSVDKKIAKLIDKLDKQDENMKAIFEKQDT